MRCTHEIEQAHGRFEAVLSFSCVWTPLAIANICYYTLHQHLTYLLHIKIGIFKASVHNYYLKTKLKVIFSPTPTYFTQLIIDNSLIDTLVLSPTMI